MPKRDGDIDDPSWRLMFSAIGLMAGIALIGLIWTSIETTSNRRVSSQMAAKVRCEGNRDSGCDELAVGARSVVAAEAAADYAGMQLWTNILGLLGVFGTVFYARGAWLAAHRTAETAQRALEHGRAYVVAELGGVKELQVGERIQASVHLKNVGQTPANNVSVKGTVEVIVLGSSGDIPDWIDVSRIHLVIGPTLDKFVSISSSSPLSQEDHDAVVSKKSIVVVGGAVVYDDIFGKTWWTQFCHIYAGGEVKGTYHTQLNRTGGPV